MGTVRRLLRWISGSNPPEGNRGTDVDPGGATRSGRGSDRNSPGIASEVERRAEPDGDRSTDEGTSTFDERDEDRVVDPEDERADEDRVVDPEDEHADEDRSATEESGSETGTPDPADEADTSRPDTASSEFAELTAFQRDLLVVIPGLEMPKGLEIKERMSEYYGEEVNHGRLYPNLDTLAEGGFVDKTSVDARSNGYELTERGRAHLSARREWETQRVTRELSMDGRTGDQREGPTPDEETPGGGARNDGPPDETADMEQSDILREIENEFERRDERSDDPDPS